MFGVPVFTLLIGLGYFLLPRMVLGSIGIEANPSRPEAIGEGRSSFAGFLIGTSLVCLLLQVPAAPQPGLNFALAFGWLLAASGKIIHIGFDGARSKGVFTRLFVALALGGIMLIYAEPIQIFAELPQDLGATYVFLVALITVIFGLFTLIVPNLGLKVLRLQTKVDKNSSVGELRGTLSGFYLGVGGVVLLSSWPFIGLLLSACWCATAFGRMISMLSDRGNTFYNWLILVLELILAAVPIAVVFNFIP